MSTKIGMPYTQTGLSTLYAVVRDPNNSRKLWRVSDSTWQTETADRTNFALALTETATGSYHYVVDFPSGIASGLYVVEYYLRAGSAGAAGDTFVYVDDPFQWSGTARVNGGLTTPAEAAGRPTTLEGMLRRLFEWTANKKTRDRATGFKKVYGTDGTTVLETQTQSTVTTVDQETQGA